MPRTFATITSAAALAGFVAALSGPAMAQYPDRPIRAATVSLGYADGFLRGWTGKGALRWGESVLPLLGRVSMDMVVVDADAAPALREGDWLEVPYSLPEAAALSGLSQYELLTVLGRRFVRSI